MTGIAGGAVAEIDETISARGKSFDLNGGDWRAAMVAIDECRLSA